MEDLLLTGPTRAQLTALATDAPHALLITGPDGIGKYAVAKAWALRLTAPAHISVVSPDEKSTISIDVIRTLYQHTRSKHDARQVVIIDNAQSMGLEAQTAFLKLLEEPNTAVTFVLTAPTAEALLPTITSRAQALALPRLGLATLRDYAMKHNASLTGQELSQLLFVADGRPGILARLLTDPEVLAGHKAIMQRAKKLLTASAYERLSAVTELSKDRQQLVATLEAMEHMLYLQIMRDPQPRLIALADNLETCLLRLAQNGNPRAQLTALFRA